jgi:bifunctional DNase/RNase
MSVEVEMKIKALIFDPVSNMPIIVLKSENDEDVLPIWVGIFEANAIAVRMENIVTPRPMTHDLLKSVIEGLQAKIRGVEITDLKDNTFFAVIRLDLDGRSLEIDSRPSDAMALALRAGAPIFVRRSVLDKSGSAGEEGDTPETERLRRWLETVDPSELGKYEM